MLKILYSYIVKSKKDIHSIFYLQRIAAETKTKGGILLPEKAQNKTLEAMVVAVGPGMRNEAGTNIPMAVQVGDKVLLPEFGGAKVSGSGSYYIIL